jgi:hypothetical protein
MNVIELSSCGTVGAIPYPGLVAEAPKSLKELIRDAVESISFQLLRFRRTLIPISIHLFNEAMPQLRPIHNTSIFESITLVLVGLGSLIFTLTVNSSTWSCSEGKAHPPF